MKLFGDTGLNKLLTLLKAKFDNKVDKETGKGLSTNDFTTILKDKLDGIEEGANKYTHPSHTAAKSGFYKITVDALGHVTAVTEVAKSDITGLGIPGQDTTYVIATSDIDGLLSKEDKVKLDGIATGANKYVHPSYTAQDSGFYKVTVDATGHVSAVTAVSKEDITGLGIPGALTPLSTDVETDATSDAKATTPKAVKTYVDNLLGSTYKAAGSAATVTDLPALSKANVGKVVNMSAEFTTTADFLEGAGKVYPIGTNVAVVNPSGTTYKYDVLSGFVDLSPYAKTTDFVEYTEEEVENLWNTVFTA